MENLPTFSEYLNTDEHRLCETVAPSQLEFMSAAHTPAKLLCGTVATNHPEEAMLEVRGARFCEFVATSTEY